MFAIRALPLAIFGLLSCSAACSSCQENTDSRETILADQKRLVDQYKLLEDKLFSLYQHERDQNPDRSVLLQRAFQQSKKELTLARLNTILRLIDQQQLRDAEKNQGEVLKQLQSLLELLQSEDRGKRVRDEIQRHKEYLKEVNRLLRMQKGIRGQAESDVESSRLQNSQENAADRTQRLADNIKQDEQSQSQEPSGEPQPSSGETPAQPQQPGQGTPNGKPADGQKKPADPSAQPQQNPVRDRLQQAEQKMRSAQRKLDQAERNNSIEDMQQAEQQLAQAKKELEEILKQLREEEAGRVLADLESRFRQMLEKQVKLLEKTIQTDETSKKQRRGDFEIACGKLSVDQKALATDAGRTLLVLQDDGSSIAIPETVRQMQIDMQQSGQRLSGARVGLVTQEIQRDIVQTLELLVDAVSQAQENLEDKQQDAQGQAGPPGEESLVDQLAELKLVRGWQDRIYRRHQRYAQLLDNPEDLIGETQDLDLRSALGRLRDQQLKVQQITREIVVGKNK